MWQIGDDLLVIGLSKGQLGIAPLVAACLVQLHQIENLVKASRSVDSRGPAKEVFEIDGAVRGIQHRQNALERIAELVLPGGMKT